MRFREGWYVWGLLWLELEPSVLRIPSMQAATGLPPRFEDFSGGFITGIIDPIKATL